MVNKNKSPQKIMDGLKRGLKQIQEGYLSIRTEIESQGWLVNEKPSKSRRDQINILVGAISDIREGVTELRDLGVFGLEEVGMSTNEARDIIDFCNVQVHKPKSQLDERMILGIQQFMSKHEWWVAPIRTVILNEVKPVGWTFSEEWQLEDCSLLLHDGVAGDKVYLSTVMVWAVLKDCTIIALRLPESSDEEPHTLIYQRQLDPGEHVKSMTVSIDGQTILTMNRDEKET